MKYRIMFLGGPETGNIDKNVWGHTDGYHAIPGGPLVCPVREWVTVDPGGEPNKARREFLRHVLSKAKTNRFYKCEEVVEDTLDETEAEQPRRGRPRKVDEAVS